MSSNGKKIKIINGGGKQLGMGGRRPVISFHRKAEQATKGEKLLQDFVWANKDLVDKEVCEGFFTGNKQVVTEALNQIHWRSLKLRGGFEWKEKPKIDMLSYSKKVTHGKSYAEAVLAPLQQRSEVLGNAYEQKKNPSLEGEEDWTVVRNRKRKVQKEKVEVEKDWHTIFLYNIPEKTRAKEVWECLRNTGIIMDVILPRKRDKKNKRYGFVKTTSELEAGTIILNAKEKGGLAARIRMSILDKNLPRKRINPTMGKKAPGTSNTIFYKNKPNKLPNDKNQIDPNIASVKNTQLKNEKEGLGTKMFEYTEANLVDDDIVEGLYATKIGFSRYDETSGNLQDKLESAGIEKIRVVGLNERKFILKSEKSDMWDSFDCSVLDTWFSKVSNFQDKDLVVPRVVWLESQGVAMTAWLEENFKGYTHHLGDWVSWSYQRMKVEIFSIP